MRHDAIIKGLSPEKNVKMAIRFQATDVLRAVLGKAQNQPPQDPAAMDGSILERIAMMEIRKTETVVRVIVLTKELFLKPAAARRLTRINKPRRAVFRNSVGL